MKLSFLSSTVTLAVVTAKPHYKRDFISDWAPGGPDDFRGPCPMMNTLANHGFLPHDGRNITRENAVSALTNGLNFDPAVANIMWEQAIFINPEPNATFFTLDQLNKHNVLEHDASLSRSDAFFGNNHVFNASIFAETTQYWTGSTLNANMLAMGKVARQVTSKAFNPTYTFTSTVENFSLGELAAPILIFGDIPGGTVDREKVVFFFENEKLPTDLGWTKQASPITLDQVMATSNLIKNATNLFTPSATDATTHAKRANFRDLHLGVLSA